ncbi:MAG TPA: hypothetical protein VFE92_11080 [Dermatophilaceae bacterium]|jgi:hypothetical protein|nr:hypothetical protein [Dermatophilaceae bacterium]
MSLSTRHVECSRASTALIAEVNTEPGLTTYTLDPEHFSQVAAEGIGAILETLATNGSWRYHGENRRCATEFQVLRNPDRPSGAPVVCCNDPGWTAISVDADEITEVGRAALEGAILAQLSGWEQSPIEA